MSFPNPRIVGIKELFAREPTEYTIPRILPLQGLVTLVAEPSSKKTFLAVEVAACVATGHSFFGHPTRQGSVIYIAAEGQAGIRKRFAAWERDRGVELQSSQLGIIDQALRLNDPSSIDGIRASLVAFQDENGPISLLVIDTLNRNFCGDENSPRDMTVFVAHCTALAQEFNLACLILHHPAKSGNGGSRGHSALHGAVDVGWAIENGRKEKFTVRFDDKPPKDDAPQRPLVLTTRRVDLSDLFGCDDEGRPYDSLVLEQVTPEMRVPKVTKQDQLKDLILGQLTEEPWARGDLLLAIKARDHRASDKTFGRALDGLVSEAKIERVGQGTYRKLS
jgi:hypothetical protein